MFLGAHLAVSYFPRSNQAFVETAVVIQRSVVAFTLGNTEGRSCCTGATTSTVQRR